MPALLAAIIQVQQAKELDAFEVMMKINFFGDGSNAVSLSQTDWRNTG